MSRIKRLINRRQKPVRFSQKKFRNAYGANKKRIVGGKDLEI